MGFFGLFNIIEDESMRLSQEIAETKIKIKQERQEIKNRWKKYMPAKLTSS